MNYSLTKLEQITKIKTGKLNSNASVPNGDYPFFTCDPNTLRTNTFSFDTNAVLLAGNNASGNYTAKYFSGKFDVYQRTYVIESVDEDVLSTRYLSYAINQELRNLKTMSAGSTTKFLKIGMLHNLEIPLPSIDIQRRIASILSAYDDLIENNHKQIKLLEEAALRLYKEWFVSLHFPGHENTTIVDGLPEGWFKGKLSDLIEIKYGKDHKKIPDGIFPVYGSGGLMRKCSQKLHEGESILIPRKGSLNNIMYVNEAFWTVDTMFYSQIKKECYAKYIYYVLSAHDMYGMNIGAAVPSMTTSILNNIDLIVPSSDVIKKFDDIIEPIYKRKKVLFNKCETISQARDKLLPKLMNGEIEV